MSELPTAHRPRNVDWKRAAAMLYGDWGTSKAYVIGIAFALSMYSSFWFVLAIGALTALVGVNYIWVCKYFPEGGGVYSSAKAHSRHLALIGGFLLVADYVVTASLSCYDAFLYLGFTLDDAKRWAILTIFIIGVINFFGPRHSGSLAVLFAVSTFGVLVVLAVACLPHIPTAIAHLEAPHRDPWHWWAGFVGVVLALSGVESVANMTGVMQPDLDSEPGKVRVTRTARKAILPVLLEVVLFTTLFGLVMLAIPELGRTEHTGDMLKYLGNVFVDQKLVGFPVVGWLGEHSTFSWIVSMVLGGLLLSAVNTAIIALVSILYLMSKDKEFPDHFSVLNRFGVPWILMLIAMLAPILVINVQKGEAALHGLADMYGIGVVGAIAVNLGSCAFNFKIPMLRYERGIMLFTFLICAAIEITIAVTKPAALLFAVIVLSLGFAARALHKGFHIPLPAFVGRMRSRLFPEAAARRHMKMIVADKPDMLSEQLGRNRPIGAIMVAARGVTPTLRFAVDQARANKAQLFVLFVREQFTTIPVPVAELEDEEAQTVFQAVKMLAGDLEVITIYALSDDAAWTILDNAAIAGADILILGHSRRGTLTRMLRGSLMQQLSDNLPEEIRLVIVS